MNDKKMNTYDFKKEFRKDWYLLLLILAMFFVSIILYSELPERMPTHWNISGEVDNYSSRFWGAFMMPLINLAIFLLMLLTPLIDPKKDNYQKFSSSYRIIRSIFIVFFAVLHFLVLAFSLGYNIDLGSFVVFGIGILFIILGNYMPKVRHNYFLGIKVPWTLANEKVWKKTHRMTGKLYLLSGATTLLGTFFGVPASFWVLMICVFGSSLGSIVYSYFIYRQEKDD